MSVTGDAYSVVYSSEFTPGIIRYSFKKMSADEKRVNAGKFFMVPSSKRVTLVSPSRTIVSSIPSTKSTKTSVAMGFGLVVGAVMGIAKFAAAVLTGNPGLVTP